jgi:ATP-dependent RNA helicase RhlE
MSFASLELSAQVLQALQARGYATPTPIQSQAIPPVLAGNDLLGIAQTGTGKTAAFALPIIHNLTQNRPTPTPPHADTPSPVNHGARKIRALILTPTRELANQVADSFHTYGKHTTLRHTVIFGGVPQDRQTKILRHGVDILIATPGRLLDLMNQGYVRLGNLQTLVLDEADQMMDMGFIHDIRRIVAVIPKQRQTLMFSATMPPEIRQLADSILKNPTTVQVAPSATPIEAIKQSVQYVQSKSDKPGALVRYLNDNGITRALVFTRTKRGADKVVRHLENCGIAARALHANKSQSQRRRAMEAFKSDAPPVLVATDIAARGLHIDAISHVVNYDLPNVPETYVHRIGRTGRAGASGEAIAFCDPEERQYLRDIEKLTRQRILSTDAEHDRKDRELRLNRPQVQSPPAAARTAPRIPQQRQHSRKPATGPARNVPWFKRHAKPRSRSHSFAR